jgi:hypothetical protein
MEADPAIRSQYEAILSLKRKLRNDLPDHNSAETLSLCLDRIRELREVQNTESVVHKLRYVLVSGLAALIIGAAVFNNADSGGIMDRGAISRSLSAGLSGGNAAIEADSQASMWLRNQLANAPVVSDQLQLIRAERLTVDGRPVGRYLLTDGAAEYIYLIAPGIAECVGAPVPGHERMKQVQIDGNNAITWTENNMSFVLVSREPVSRMLRFFEQR